jgi:hypothetical protein
MESTLAGSARNSSYFSCTNQSFGPKSVSRDVDVRDVDNVGSNLSVTVTVTVMVMVTPARQDRGRRRSGVRGGGRSGAGGAGDLQHPAGPVGDG